MSAQMTIMAGLAGAAIGAIGLYAVIKQQMPEFEFPWPEFGGGSREYVNIYLAETPIENYGW